MTPEQITSTLLNNRLCLDRKSFRKHYEAPIWMSVVSIFMLGGSIKLMLSENVKFAPAMLFLLVIPVMNLLVWLNQYLILRCKQIDTNLDRGTASRIAQLTLETLQWPINKHVPGQYFQAINPFADIRTWGDELVTVIIADNKILVNSICNLEYGTMTQAGLSFGKNKQNVRRFIDTFNTLSLYPQRVEEGQSSKH
jgi:hypothetical protein